MPDISCAVIIPALDPSPRLATMVRDLLGRGVPRVIVVNDGSDSSCDGIFLKLRGMERCSLLAHDTNLGKGRALKTAFGCFLDSFPFLAGVVTADADGQHAVEDIIAVCMRVSAGDGSLVLGERSFQGKDVPKSNRLGNAIASGLFRLLYGSYIGDTQTGLRGIPAGEIPWMAGISGDRYEYEMNLLVNAKRRGLPISSIPIRTLYPGGNAHTHYDLVRDSSRIFVSLVSGLASYFFAAILSGLADILLFTLFNSCLLAFMGAAQRLLASTVIARVSSSVVNFLCNRQIFSAGGHASPRAVVRYYALRLIQLLSSWSLVYGITRLIPVHDTIVKVIVDFALGLLGYQFQLRWVFRNRDVTTAA